MSEGGTHDRRGGWVDELIAVGLVLLAGAPLLCGRTWYRDDFAGLGLPLAASFKHAFQAGGPLLWNPDIFAGYCGLGAGQSGTWYPPNYLFFGFLPLLLGFKLSDLWHLWLLARGMLGLAGELGFSRLAATLTAAVAMLGGAVASHTIHHNVIVGIGWTGPVLWLTVRVARAARPLGPALWLGAALGLMLLQSHPQYVWLALVAGLCLGLAARGEQVRPAMVLRRLAGAALLALLLAAPQLLPLAEYVHYYSRPHPGGAFGYLTAGGFEPRDLLRLLQPDLFGNPFRGTWDRAIFLYWETRGFFGTAALLLALAAAGGARGPARTAGVALVVVGLLLVVGQANPLYRVLVYVPPFSVFRAPGRFIWVVQLGVALLAGVGLDALGGEARLRRAGRTALGLVVVGWLLALVAARHGLGRLWAYPTTWLCVVGLVVGGAAIVGARGNWRRALLVVTLVELTVSWHSFAATLPDRVFLDPPPLARAVLASANKRVFDTGMANTADPDTYLRRLTSNAGVIWGLSYLRGGSEALMPIGSLTILRDMDRRSADDPRAFEFLLDRYSVGWVVTSVERHDPNLRLVAEDAGAYLYENRDARPLVYAVPVRFVNDTGVRTVPRDEVTISPVVVEEQSACRWILRTQFAEPMAVVLAQSMYPGWTVQVDGQQSWLMGAERIFMSVVVPPGDHLIEFRFDNAYIWLGWRLGLLAWAVWLAALVAERLRSRRRVSPGPGRVAREQGPVG